MEHLQVEFNKILYDCPSCQVWCNWCFFIMHLETLPHIKLWITDSYKGVNLCAFAFCIFLSFSLSFNVCVCVCMCVHPQLIVAGCSSLPCSNIRPCRHLGPVVWALRGGNRLATGPDYFLHSPELNSVYAINQLHAVWSQLDRAINPVHKGLFTKAHARTHTHTHTTQNFTT